MALRLQILQRTSKATRIQRLQLHQVHRNSMMVQALPIPRLLHSKTCLMPTTADHILGGTSDIAVGTASPARISPRHLPTFFLEEVFPMGLVLAIIVNPATSAVRCLRASVATKKMKAWQLPSNCSLAALVAPVHQGLSSLSLSLRMHRLCLISLRST